MVDGVVRVRRAGADRIVFVGHATVMLELDGVRALTDPLLRRRVVHLRRQHPLPQASTISGPDVVLISHLHHDHLDVPSLRLLGSDTPLIVPTGVGAWLRRRRFTNVTEVRAGAQANVGTLTIAALEARHDGRRRPGGPRAEALGYLVSAEKRVYFAGDTELFAGMSEIGAGPTRLDVALLPVGGWGTTLGPGHMDPLQAAAAARMLRPRVAIPIHWGTLLPVGTARRDRVGLRDPPRLFAEHVARLAPEVEVRILEPGEETKF